MKMFMDSLADAVREKRSPLMVGLDPRLASLPEPLKVSKDAPLPDIAEAYRAFCCGVIDAVHEFTPIVKPQVAFFEQLGPAGMEALLRVIEHASANNLLICMDCKRGDIGSTAEAYADGWLGAESAWGADALTVNPYLGDDSLAPFLTMAKERDAGLFVLVKTSNPGGRKFQDLACSGATIYQRVGSMVEEFATETAGDCGYGLAGAVVGATYPQQLSELRGAMPHTWFLVPGFGAQGGSAADVAGAFDASGLGAVVNSSRGVIFAFNQPQGGGHSPDDWQGAVRTAAEDAVKRLRSETSAGAL